jgi:hypothetical protein
VQAKFSHSQLDSIGEFLQIFDENNFLILSFQIFGIVVIVLGASALANRDVFEIVENFIDTSCSTIIPALFIIMGVLISFTVSLGSLVAYKNWKLLNCLRAYCVAMAVYIIKMVYCVWFGSSEKDELLSELRKYYEAVFKNAGDPKHSAVFDALQHTVSTLKLH